MSVTQTTLAMLGTIVSWYVLIVIEHRSTSVGEVNRYRVTAR